MLLDKGAIHFCIAAYMLVGGFCSGAGGGLRGVVRRAGMAARLAAAREGWKGEGHCQCRKQYYFNFCS